MPRPRRGEPADALIELAPLVTRWMERLLAARQPPLTLAQYLTLRAVAGGEVMAARLARAAGVSDAAVSQTLAALERMGLVARSRAGEDRRQQPVEMTEAGRDVLGAARGALRGRLGELLEPLPPPQAHALADALAAATAAVAGVPPPRRPPPPPPPPPHRYDRRR
jgi:DNA-binding MarR family transcriptional regulator